MFTDHAILKKVNAFLKIHAIDLINWILFLKIAIKYIQSGKIKF